MKERKYRVWIEETKTMQYSDVLSSFFKDHENSNRPIMDYIGLKDRHGKDIYDGDIVMYDKPYLVYWAKGRVGFWCVNGKDCREFGINDNVEVIGNIHKDDIAELER